MSRENVEIARRGYEAWNAGDVDAMLAMFDPNLEYVSSGVFPGLEPVYRGHEGWLRFWREFRGTWDSLNIEVDELRDLGDRVVALLAFDATGRDGIRVRRPLANVWTFRSARVTRLEAFGSPAEALEAVGLRE